MDEAFIEVVVMNKSNGNVLFLILIAVALFAALSYAVTQSSRGGGSANREALALDAAQLIQYGDRVDYAVKRMLLTGGYSKTEISFENNGNAVNGNCVEDGCKVFDPNGGGVHYWEIPEDWRGPHGSSPPLWRWSFSRDFPVYDVGTNCADPSCNDVVLLYRGLSRDLCVRINEVLEIDNPNGEPPENTVRTNNDYTGTLSFYDASELIGSANPADDQAVLNGQYVGCFRDPHTADLAYHFYRFVLEH